MVSSVGPREEQEEARELGSMEVLAAEDPGAQFRWSSRVRAALGVGCVRRSEEAATCWGLGAADVVGSVWIEGRKVVGPMGKTRKEEPASVGGIGSGRDPEEESGGGRDGMDGTSP